MINVNAKGTLFLHNLKLMDIKLVFRKKDHLNKNHRPHITSSSISKTYEKLAKVNTIFRVDIFRVFCFCGCSRVLRQQKLNWGNKLRG